MVNVAREDMKTSDLALLLILLYLSGERIEGRKRLQKLVCILKHEHQIPFSYDFRPYYYGPYSENLTEAIDTLVSLGYIKEEREMLTDYISKYVYELTTGGKKTVSLTISKLKKTNPSLVTKLQAVIGELKTKNTEELVMRSKLVSNLY